MAGRQCCFSFFFSKSSKSRIFSLKLVAKGVKLRIFNCSIKKYFRWIDRFSETWPTFGLELVCRVDKVRNSKIRPPCPASRPTYSKSPSFVPSNDVEFLVKQSVAVYKKLGQRWTVPWPPMFYMDDVIISKISREAIIKPTYSSFFFVYYGFAFLKLLKNSRQKCLS